MTASTSSPPDPALRSPQVRYESQDDRTHYPARLYSHAHHKRHHKEQDHDPQPSLDPDPPDRHPRPPHHTRRSHWPNLDELVLPSACEQSFKMCAIRAGKSVLLFAPLPTIVAIPHGTPGVEPSFSGASKFLLIPPLVTWCPGCMGDKLTTFIGAFNLHGLHPRSAPSFKRPRSTRSNRPTPLTRLPHPTCSYFVTIASLAAPSRRMYRHAPSLHHILLASPVLPGNVDI